MNKKLYTLLVVLVLMLFGCSSNKKDEENGKFHIDDKYYNTGQYIKIDSSKLSKLNKESYILYVYNNYCIFSVPCDNIFEEVMKKNNIDILSIPFEEFKKTSLYKTVKFAPSVIIIKKGKIIAYLDAESDEDLNRYQDTEEFESWLDKYIYLSK